MVSVDVLPLNFEIGGGPGAFFTHYPVPKVGSFSQNNVVSGPHRCGVGARERGVGRERAGGWRVDGGGGGRERVGGGKDARTKSATFFFENRLKTV